MLDLFKVLTGDHKRNNRDKEEINEDKQNNRNIYSLLFFAGFDKE